jgi:putative transcriptional regulator
MLRKLRTSMGITQSQFAKNLGVSQSAITHIETGKRGPSPALARRIVRLAKTYQIPCSLEDLYPLTSEDREATRPDGHTTPTPPHPSISGATRVPEQKTPTRP